MSRHLPAMAAAVALLASACASVPAPKPVDLSQQCLKDIRQLPVNAVAILAPAAEKKLRPRDYSQFARCVEASDGSKLAVALFKLEGVPTPANLRLVLSESGGGVLAAAVTLLNEDFAAVDRIGFGRFVNRGTSNTLDVVINDPAVRYFLVSPDGAGVGKSEKQFRTQINSTAVPIGLGAMFMLTTGRADERQRAYSDAGMLAVTVRPAGPLPVLRKK